jgi:oligopeptide/dipeptide ABC transporter ATP-binding protein
MLALMGLVAYPGRVRADRMRFAGKDLLGMSDKARRALVGKDIAMIFQEPSTSLNPCFTIGFQLIETLRLHLKLDKRDARKRATELLEQVGIPAASSRLGNYPHQLSGGMNQRVMIAMAIACNPRLLIADEPTTALDVTIQAQILDLLRDLQKERGMALVLITHNMGVVSEMAQRIAVMYAGQVMEQQRVDRLFASPQHPYTEALLAALPERAAPEGRLATISGVVPGVFDRPAGCLFAPRCAYATSTRARCGPRCANGRARTGASAATSRWRAGPQRPSRDPPRERLAEVAPCRGIGRAWWSRPATCAHVRHPPRHVPRARRNCSAVGGISFRIERGRTLAVVGESGCGKSTLARMVALVEKPTAGTLTLDGIDAVNTPKDRSAELRQAVQLVFQNPYGSLNPRKKISAVLEDPLAINTDAGQAERAELARDMLARVGLRPEHANRYPHMFSGGQRQRIAIARALMLHPALLVADEPVSALDVSIQAQVLNLLADLQAELPAWPTCSSRTTSRGAPHRARRAGDVPGPRRWSRARVAQDLRAAAAPVHAGAAGLHAGPGLSSQRIVLQGELPSPLNPPAGCVFSTRCPHVRARCREERPLPRMVDGRLVACHFADDFSWRAGCARCRWRRTAHNRALAPSVNVTSKESRMKTQSPFRAAQQLGARRAALGPRMACGRRIGQDAGVLLRRQPGELLSGREHHRHLVRRQRRRSTTASSSSSAAAPRSCRAWPRSGTSRRRHATPSTCARA